MANSDGSEAMLNRVMTKDNIGVAVVLEVHKELFGTGECHLNSIEHHSRFPYLRTKENLTAYYKIIFLSFENC